MSVRAPSFLGKLRSTRRQTLAFAALLGMLLLTGLLALGLQFWSDREVHTELELETQRLTVILETRGSAERMAAAIRAYVLSRYPSYQQRYEASRDQVSQGLVWLEQEAPDPDARAHVTALATMFEGYKRHCDQLSHAVQHAESDAAVAESMPLWRMQVLPAYEQLEHLWNTLITQQQARVDALHTRLRRYEHSAALLGHAFLLLLVSSAAFAIWTYRNSLHRALESHQTVEQALEALRISEEEQRLTLDGVTEHAIIRLDREGRVASWNDGARRIQGYDAKEVLGRPVDIFFTLADRSDGLPQHLLSRAAQQGSHTTDCWLQQANGRRFRASVTLSALRAEDGSVRGYVQVCHDISARFELEEQLREAIAQNEFVQQAAGIGVWQWNPDTDEMWWSDSLKSQLGYAPGELEPCPLTFNRLLHPQERQQVWAILQEAREHRLACYEHTFRLQRRDGSWQWTLMRGKWYEAPSTQGASVLLGVHLDISDLYEAQERLTAEREAALVTLHSIGEGLIVTDGQGRIEQMNQSACTMTGWHVEEARGRPVSEVFRLIDERSSQPLPDPVALCLGGTRQETPQAHQVARLLTRSGDALPIEESVAPIDIAGKRRGAVLVFRDVSEARRLMRDISWEASHDALTGLLNRREFNRRLEHALAHPDEQARHALLYFDLDRFKVVNDSCGHAAGDELLRQLARLVDDRLRERDSFARLGGDEFAVLLEHCALPHAHSVAENILTALREWHFICKGRAFQVGASIGLVPFEPGRFKPDELMQWADQAAYAAKQAGRGRVTVHVPGAVQVDEQHQQESGFAQRLGEALREDRFELHAQPIVPVRVPDSGERCEILLRLRGDDGRLLPPGSFLPAAERNEMMSQLDRHVVEKTLRLLVRMPERLAQLAMCTINLSPSTLEDAGYASHVEQLLRETGVPADKICFEITEAAAVSDLLRVRDFIHRLRALGCRIALDHFGTGMGSFTYLKQLPIDYIKIDGSFVTGLSESSLDQTLVRAINEVSHEMGCQTIAEFVPDNATLEVLRRIGIDFAQGYGVGSPARLETTA